MCRRPSIPSSMRPSSSYALITDPSPHSPPTRRPSRHFQIFSRKWKPPPCLGLSGTTSVPGGLDLTNSVMPRKRPLYTQAWSRPEGLTCTSRDRALGYGRGMRASSRNEWHRRQGELIRGVMRATPCMRACVRACVRIKFKASPSTTKTSRLSLRSTASSSFGSFQRTAAPRTNQQCQRRKKSGRSSCLSTLPLRSSTEQPCSRSYGPPCCRCECLHTLSPHAHVCA